MLSMVQKILVTGASGFIAGHTIEKLLLQGHEVVGTVRDPNNSEKNAHLHAMNLNPKNKSSGKLSLVAADLTAADPFSAHVDVEVVMHMASPYTINVKNPQTDLVDPAVMGTLSLLRAAAKSPRIKRVVLTSSVAAITDEPDGRVLTENDWNTESSLTRNPYYFSKFMAEKAAWDFMKTEKPNFNLVVINPFIVIGPSHTSAINASNQILVDVINGKYPATMALEWGFVDVRDVADAHIAAMNVKQASGRHICASATMTMADTVALIRQSGYGHAKLPKFNLSGSFGTALMRLASYTQPVGVGSYLRTHLGRVLRFNNSKARTALGIDFRPVPQSIKDTLIDLSQWKHIPEARG
jgi:dihydroflavonol-4-reductase